MIKYKLEQQHRPFWGFIERHFVAFIVIDVLGILTLAVYFLRH